MLGREFIQRFPVVVGWDCGKIIKGIIIIKGKSRLENIINSGTYENQTFLLRVIHFIFIDSI